MIRDWMEGDGGQLHHLKPMVQREWGDGLCPSPIIQRH